MQIMKTLVFLLEEPSAKEMLKGLFDTHKKALFDAEEIDIKYITFNGKQDLEKNIELKIKKWLTVNSYFMVIRDQDAGDCHAIKRNLIAICEKTGKLNKISVRIACHSLESFYLGDLGAVEAGLKLNGLKKLENKNPYREPDKISNPVQILERITSGNGYQKISGSRAISPYLDINNNKSSSFNALICGIRNIIKNN